MAFSVINPYSFATGVAATWILVLQENRRRENRRKYIVFIGLRLGLKPCNLIAEL
jgi:hypothetical protein